MIAKHHEELVSNWNPAGKGTRNKEDGPKDGKTT